MGGEGEEIRPWRLICITNQAATRRQTARRHLSKGTLMALTGTYTDTDTGAKFQDAYAKIFPVQMQSVANPITGALPWGRYAVNVWINKAAHDAGRGVIATYSFTMEGERFLMAFAAGAQICKSMMDTATDYAAQMHALEAGILGPAEADAITQEPFETWTIV